MSRLESKVSRVNCAAAEFKRVPFLQSRSSINAFDPPAITNCACLPKTLPAPEFDIFTGRPIPDERCQVGGRGMQMLWPSVILARCDGGRHGYANGTAGQNRPGAGGDEYGPTLEEMTNPCVRQNDGSSFDLAAAQTHAIVVSSFDRRRHCPVPGDDEPADARRQCDASQDESGWLRNRLQLEPVEFGQGRRKTDAVRVPFEESGRRQKAADIGRGGGRPNRGGEGEFSRISLTCENDIDERIRLADGPLPSMHGCRA